MHTKTTYFTINTQSVTLCTLFVIAILEMLNVICQWSKALHDTFGFKIHTTLCSIWVIVFGCVSFACSRSLVMVYAEEIFERIIRLLRSLVCLLLFRHSVRPLELCLFFYSNALAMNKYQKTHTQKNVYFFPSFIRPVCLFVCFQSNFWCINLVVLLCADFVYAHNFAGDMPRFLPCLFLLFIRTAYCFEWI